MTAKIVLGFLFLSLAGALLYYRGMTGTGRISEEPGLSATVSPSPLEEINDGNESVRVVAGNLDTPWAIAFLPDSGILVTERPGRVRLVNSEGVLENEPVAVLESVKEIGEGGLLGLALHPEFSENNYVYFYYTYEGSGNNTFNRVVRMHFRDGKLTDEEIIVDGIPGASNHNGGRIKFGPDGNLYIGTGDAQEPSGAQDTSVYAGKILRVTPEGKPTAGNPFNNHVYSYGHRNVQGLSWDSNGQLWATEHGRSGISSGLDEVNLIIAGKNYGWPEIQGDESRQGMYAPVRHSGVSNTWAPAGAAFINDSLYFGGLRGQTLYEAVTAENRIVEFKEHFRGRYGRIREVIKGPDSNLYITTSNQDGRGNPEGDDDRIILINPSLL
ncbi:MAG: quinoprotein glucose dehydrogenase [Candidatus Gottesmanbacteria bacterium GW2011_GWA2_43_14]|uniref:Quinoprotein glucose dehydrogenase n=1 Tax=Candidatus Gottesmanbacteria bacterium GW2011_GWA2_43_14 TaxID=1618443 RepID=A0A0G1DFP5_9BACT|nr:MAG: quinoprotein glucose dehydrogenase [Candidatus Gottesmanbacteria bacterium GW2011_GWA2_43_14]